MQRRAPLPCCANAMLRRFLLNLSTPLPFDLAAGCHSHRQTLSLSRIFRIIHPLHRVSHCAHACTVCSPPSLAPAGLGALFGALIIPESGMTGGFELFVKGMEGLAAGAMLTMIAQVCC